MTNKITHTFNCGTGGKVECDFELPVEWLDYLLQQLSGCVDCLPHGITEFRATNQSKNLADLRNYCVFRIPPKEIITLARRELSLLKKLNKP